MVITRERLVDANKAVQLLPNYYRGYFRRAMVYRCLNEYEKGLADCDQAEKLAPLSPQPIRAHGKILQAQGKLPEAIAEFSRAIELSPKWATLYFERADTHKRAGDHQSAIDDYTVTISLMPDEIPRNSVEIIKRRAESYRALENSRKRPLTIPRPLSSFRIMLGRDLIAGTASSNSDATIRALDDFERAIELAPTRPFIGSRQRWPISSWDSLKKRFAI